MKSDPLALLCLLFAAPLYAGNPGHLVPAGSLIQCTVSEPRISSKTTAIGDPVLCQVRHEERYGRSVMPYNSFLVGRFEDYKDPGHFVGKGWMELKFDHMVVEPDTVIPVDARVIDVPGYRVDEHGRILGKGHAVRDAVMWSIPVLWPVDLLMLPMRGPRPTLKEETRLTLKVMDDFGVPATELPQHDPYGLIPRSPTAQNDVPPAPYQEPEAAPAPEPDQGAQADNYAPPMQVAPPMPPPVYYYPAPPPAPVYYGYGVVPPLGIYGRFGGPAMRYGYGYAPRGGLRYGYGRVGGGRPGYGSPMRGAGGGRPGAMMAMRGGGGGGARRGGR